MPAAMAADDVAIEFRDGNPGVETFFAEVMTDFIAFHHPFIRETQRIIPGVLPRCTYWNTAFR
jgi:hypothetical protein